MADSTVADRQFFGLCVAIYNKRLQHVSAVFSNRRSFHRASPLTLVVRIRRHIRVASYPWPDCVVNHQNLAACSRQLCTVGHRPCNFRRANFKVAGRDFAAAYRYCHVVRTSCGKHCRTIVFKFRKRNIISRPDTRTCRHISFD